MSRYLGRHRKPTTAGRTVAKVAITGLVVGAPLAAFAGTASAAPATTANNWDAVAQCESGGNWSINTGNGFGGGLQFTPSTWSAYGGQGSAQNASREQQIQVAERVLAGQGAGAWPVCGKSLGAANPTPVQAQTKSAPAKSQSAPVQQSVKSQSAPVQQSAPAKQYNSQQSAPVKQQSATTQKSTTTTQKPAVKSAPVASSNASSGSYVVQSGDTLSKIASAQGVSGGYQAIFALNQDKIQDVNLIFPGQTLRLP